FMIEKEWESGQLLIDKQRAWRAMSALEHVTRHFPFYYQHVYGDKMLFYAVWKALDQPYAMTPHAARVMAAPDGRVLLHQFDFQGSLLFHHRTEADWQLPAAGEQPGPSGAPHDEACREFLAELSRKWPEADRRCSPNHTGRRRSLLRWSSLRQNEPAQTGRSA